EALRAYARLEHATEGRVTEVSKKERRQQPPAPFNTTSLQAAAAAEGLSPARTMRLAESLYMDGLISYPRVDNTVYPDSLDLKEQLRMLKGVPQYAPYADELLGRPTLKATRGKQMTTDHPPIYPTGVADPDKLQPAAWKLYNLVARRFMATLSDAAVIEGTKVSLDVEGEPMQASGDVLVKPGFRAIYPFGMKKDEQLPALVEGDVCSVVSMDFEHKQTEPPPRYSQGRLVQEMEKRGLGTKSTRASIIERLFEVKYLKGDPIEPSQLGMAVIDALHNYAPHVTSPDMTSELEQSMTQVAEGQETQEGVVRRSRSMLAGMMDELIEHKDDLGEAISEAVTADARVGACPKCGKDLVMKSSAKTRGSFIGCMGWPDCDVTYPVPSRVKIDPLEGDAAVCPECGAPRISCKPFRSKAYEQCVNPACATNREPDVVVGECAACAEAGRTGKLIAHKSERTGKRFIRCENYELCETSYPLPQRGELKATGETCPECGAPFVEVTTARGPWKLCVNMDCPSKEKKATSRGRAKTTSSRAKSTSRAKKSTSKSSKKGA
ncbi:MAG: topoisomerase DNA-binding C4 zinc finger domain-containing protein, partial [Atopobiaceae bacterium]|nr:topoisomerase DNA-binding C4 zinc finger domain-containing protein [Atopobiaceae bacterium]